MVASTLLRERDGLGMKNLFEELQVAIDSGDTEEMNRLSKMIFDGVKDESINESLVKSLRGKQIYKNMAGVCNESKELDKTDYIKMVSSLITHNIIECEIQKAEISESPVKELYVLLGDLLNGSDGAVERATGFVKERYGKFML